MAERTRRGRKLLIASLGVAAVSYVACGGSTESDNGGTNDAGVGGSRGTGGASVGGSGGSQTAGGPVGNLMPFPIDSGTGGYQGTGGSATGGDVGNDGGPSDAAADSGPVIDWDVVANLVPPPPSDD